MAYDFNELKRHVLAGTIDPNEFHEKLSNESIGVERKVYCFFNTPELPIRIYRARVFEDLSGLPKYVRDLSYPPAEKCGLGRANVAGEQIFYASAGLPTTLPELKDAIKVGSIVVVSEWRSTSRMILQPVGILDGKNSDSDYEQLLGHIFTNAGNELYKYSSMIAKSLIGTAEEPAGILYPSIHAQNQNHNVALKKAFADKSLYFVNAVVYRIKEIKETFIFEADEIDFATSDSGNLKLKGSIKTWSTRYQGDTLKLVKTEWGWDAFRPDGTLADPE